MGAGRAGGDSHARRDQPGVLALGDPHQHLHLARGQHAQQPGSLVVGLGRGVEQLREGPLEQLGRHGGLARARLHHGALDTLDPLVVAHIAGRTGGEGGGYAAWARHRAEHHDRDLRPLLLDLHHRVEHPWFGG
ncbi:hypothetical protein GCM10009680_14780 [Streptomyces yatensis]|uniref:Uncharacterized protein n=1 Tax=Streptomyces yatensis TaxID=155177 RepID=A0ABN2GSV6_9ACTN